MSKLCPKCEQGRLVHQVEQHFVFFEGETGSVNNFYSICERCGYEQTDKEEQRLNQEALNGFHFIVLEKAKVLP